MEVSFLKKIFYVTRPKIYFKYNTIKTIKIYLCICKVGEGGLLHSTSVQLDLQQKLEEILKYTNNSSFPPLTSNYSTTFCNLWEWFKCVFFVFYFVLAFLSLIFWVHLRVVPYKTLVALTSTMLFLIDVLCYNNNNSTCILECMFL